MNYYERGLFNQMVGSRRDVDSTDSPEVTYFVPVQPGRVRRYGNTGTCCGGTGMESATKYQDSIYFRSTDGRTLYVNLYIDSTLEWPEKGFAITQSTGFPFDGSSSLGVDGSGPLDIRLRVPTWVRKGYTLTVNGEAQEVEAEPGTYVSIDRSWSPGDRIDISMPFSVWTERAIDDASVQSIFYGPTLLVLQAGPVGDDLESGLIGVSFYRDVKLDGDLAPAMSPDDGPLHFTSNGYGLVPFFVADPQEGDTRPYHTYVRRNEPRVVFGSVDAGVENPARESGLTFLDAVWDEAPFAGHEEFVNVVRRVAREWQGEGLLTESAERAIVGAAERAEQALRI
jgi:hypothetical protein